MRSRSQIHLLTVAAARLEEDHANPKLIADLREAAGFKAKKRARAETLNDHDAAEDNKRIERQRTLFNTLPDSERVAALRKAMLQRAYDLLWDGDCMGCDALTEFLPSADVEKMLDAWQDDQFDKAKSKWYGGDA